jgi:hypothetical protein
VGEEADGGIEVQQVPMPLPNAPATNCLICGNLLTHAKIAALSETGFPITPCCGTQLTPAEFKSLKSSRSSRMRKTMGRGTGRPGTALSCPDCHRDLLSVAAYRTHLAQCRSGLPHSCPGCLKQFTAIGWRYHWTDCQGRYRKTPTISLGPVPRNSSNRLAICCLPSLSY